MKWNFWKNYVSEPVITLGNEILVFHNWNLIWKDDRNFYRTYTLSHKEKNIVLNFSFDMYDLCQCKQEYFTKDEVIYLGKKFLKWMKEYEFIQKQTKYLKDQQER